MMSDLKSLELMALLSEDPAIAEEWQKAQMVRATVEENCVRVWTEAGREWEVRRSKKDGTTYCTCPAWRFRKDKSTTCKHVLAVQAAGMEVPLYDGKRKMGVDLGFGG